MLRLSIVTTAEHRQGAATTNDGDLPHGAIVLKHLVAPWAGTKRIVCADSYFASVTAARQLLGMGLRFIGVFMTATRGYRMGALSVIPLEAWGQHVAYTHSTADGVTYMMALLSVDKERRYFIASVSTSLMSTPYERMRWRQTGYHAERVALTLLQPQVAETYYMCCSQIDRHNRCRQDDLRLEHKLVTHDWSMRVNLSLLGMRVVDAWMLYSGARGGTATLKQSAFYEDLAEQLIDNTFDAVGFRARGDPGGAATAEEERAPRFGMGILVTPTLKRRHGVSSKEGDHRAQRACRVFKRRGTSSVCSACRESAGVELYICGPKTGRRCFDEHMKQVHELDV